MSKMDRHLAIELDPERSQMWSEAWELLLTGEYTLQQICQTLHDRGYTRRSGKPWVWEDPNSGRVKYATSHISNSFHNPFYAGWVTSKEFGIQRGEIRGNWEPLITDEEFDQGLAILAAHDENKIRRKRHTYLASGLLYMRVTS